MSIPPRQRSLLNGGTIILLGLMLIGCGKKLDPGKGVPFGKPVPPEPYKPLPAVLSLDISDDGKFLAAGLVSGVRVWRMADNYGGS